MLAKEILQLQETLRNTAVDEVVTNLATVIANAGGSAIQDTGKTVEAKMEVGAKVVAMRAVEVLTNEGFLACYIKTENGWCVYANLKF